MRGPNKLYDRINTSSCSPIKCPPVGRLRPGERRSGVDPGLPDGDHAGHGRAPGHTVQAARAGESSVT
ncbi:hypothetical protein MTO96_020682 [Rhipicephalus appendiculatus]